MEENNKQNNQINLHV